jgi:hypothetical protein
MSTVSLWKVDSRAIAACIIADMEADGRQDEITPDTVHSIMRGMESGSVFCNATYGEYAGFVICDLLPGHEGDHQDHTYDYPSTIAWAG